MLNRRGLRIKAMQIFFAYQNVKLALIRQKKENIIEKIKNEKVDDFESINNKNAKIELVSKNYDTYINEGNEDLLNSLNEEETLIIDFETKELIKLLNQEKLKTQNSLIKNIDELYLYFEKIWILPYLFLKCETEEKMDETYFLKKENWHYNFFDNKYIEKLIQTFNFQEKELWKNEKSTYLSWYRNVIKKDELFIDYQSKEKPSEKEHWDILMHILNKIIFENESIQNYFEEKDLYWNEDKKIISLAIEKILSNLKESDFKNIDEYLLDEKLKNENADFIVRLFSKTVEQDQYLNQIIKKHSKNWDFNRIAISDIVILKLTLTELMEFPNIPLKVTINEFLEIAKTYSTPKSTQFINGILSTLTKELNLNGKIKKYV